MIASQWSVQNYIELVQRLQSDGPVRVILVGGPDDREITDHIIQTCPGCLDATDLSLGDMASVLRRSNFFIGSDNARNSIAVAMGIPCIRIFNPAGSHLPTSYSNAHDASVVSKEAKVNIEGKSCKSSDPEYPVVVSVDEVWQHLKTS